MKSAPTKARHPEETKRRLVDATLRLMLQQGFAATTVDQICIEAQLTKGSFFHHFESKQAIGYAAVDAWAAFGTDLYSAAWKDPALDPLEQLHRIFEIMIGFNQQEQPCLCMVGMMSQEMALKNPFMRAVCERHLIDWTAMVTRMLAAAKKLHPPVVDFDPEAVGWFLNSLWQGSMLIGKTRLSPEMVIANIRQARFYIDSLFGLTSADSKFPVLASQPPNESMSIEANPQVFTISRTFATPRELVWQSYTQPEYMEKWFTPKGFKGQALKLDFRPGGIYHYCLTSPDGHEMWGKMIYREIDAPKRLVHINAFSNAKGETTRHPLSASWPLELLTTITFDENDGKTTLTIKWEPENANDEEKQTFAGAHDSMRQGWTGTLDNLAAYLKTI